MIRSTNFHDSTISSGSEPTVFVVDDNPETRRNTIELLRGHGYRAEGFDSAEGFLGGYDRSRSGCLVANEVLPGGNGRNLFERLRSKEISLPVVVVLGQGSVSAAVRAMHEGAFHVLERSHVRDELPNVVADALDFDDRHRQKIARQRELQRRLSKLTPAESEVLELIIAGKANKNIARQQAVSLRTVETRRQQVFQKMEADSLAELILMVVHARTGDGFDEPSDMPQLHARVE